MSMIVNCVAYSDGRRVEEVEISRISEVLKQPDRFIWIGLHESSVDLLKQVQQAFGLHDLAVEDALCAHQRPKVELYADSLFVVLRTAHVDIEQERIAFGETHIFLGARYVVVVRHGASLPYVPVRARVETTPQLLRKGPGFVDICNRLMRFDLELIPMDTQPYFRDVYDHVVRINEMVDTLRELLTTALEANFSLISIGQNEVMKRFAGWGAIIAIPTMVAGIYGMNFRFMPELDWSLGYPAVLALTIVLCATLFLRFRHAGWL